MIKNWCTVKEKQGDQMIQKFVNIEKKEKGKASFIASTANSDRYGDIVDQNSWVLEGYKKNPVILLNHRQDMLPIGRASNVSVVNGQLEIDVDFDMEDDLGASVARKVDQGFLTAVSVGFQPRKAVLRSDLPSDHKAFGKSGMYFEDAELLEVSVVTIPANSEAVAKGHQNMVPNLERLIRQIVKSELLARPAVELENVKHILQVEEEADRFIVHFAKPEMVEDVEEEVSEDVEDLANELMEEIIEEGGHDKEEEDDLEQMKHLIKYLLS